MKATKKIILSALVLAAGFLVQNAEAMPTTYMPDSSYMDGAWQGISYRNQDGYNVQVDFAAYDTQILVTSEEIAFFDKLNLPGRYIYAYEVFCAQGDYKEVANFSVFSISGNPMNVIVDSIGSSEDPGSGVAPTDKYFADSNRKGVWTFGTGHLVAGDNPEYSKFLVFSSDAAPVKGDYEVKQREGDFPTPPEIPEPASMLVLLGAGGLMLRRKKKYSLPI